MESNPGVEREFQDQVNNNNKESGIIGGPTSDSTISAPFTAKDEYHEDPLPDLLGSLKLSEEPEPDLTTLLTESFVLEDYEFHITDSSEEEVNEFIEESSGSDLEIFDLASNNSFLKDEDVNLSNSILSAVGTSSGNSIEGIGSSENVAVELDFNGTIDPSCTSDSHPSINPTSISNSKLSDVKLGVGKVTSRIKNLVSKNRRKRGNSLDGSTSGQYRVTYHNFDKPYLAPVRGGPSHFKKFLTLGQETQGFGSMSQSTSYNDIGSPIDIGMTAEELEAARHEWQSELTQTEEEIQTLRQVLNSKMRRANELKRKLGMTGWGSFAADMGQGIKNVRESTAVQKIEETFTEIGSAVASAPIYQKTESAIKATAEKTTSLLGGIGSAMSQKIGALKNTDSFRSMEERVSSAVSSVKTKMGGSRSGSVQSFDEALREATVAQGAQGEPATKTNGTGLGTTPVGSPSGGEDKPVS